MQKGTLFLFGILVVLVGIFEASSTTSTISDLLDKKHRNIASFGQMMEKKEVTLNDQLNDLMKLNPAKHVKVYQENFKVEKKASL
jgi:hypothetical protein